MQRANVYHRQNQSINFKLLLIATTVPVQTKQSEQTAKASSSIDRTPPGRVGTIIVKVVSDNQIDLKWTGIKGPDFNHYNIYMGTKSSFKVSSGVTVPTGTSTTNSYSSTGLESIYHVLLQDCGRRPRGKYWSFIKYQIWNDKRRSNINQSGQSVRKDQN